jgi:ankyrin repeat protein
MSDSLLFPPQDADGVTALHCAAANGHSFTCQLLLDEGAVVDDVTGRDTIRPTFNKHGIAI